MSFVLQRVNVEFVCNVYACCKMCLFFEANTGDNRHNVENAQNILYLTHVWKYIFFKRQFPCSEVRVYIILQEIKAQIEVPLHHNVHGRMILINTSMISIIVMKSVKQNKECSMSITWTQRGECGNFSSCCRGATLRWFPQLLFTSGTSQSRHTTIGATYLWHLTDTAAFVYTVSFFPVPFFQVLCFRSYIPLFFSLPSSFTCLFTSFIFCSLYVIFSCSLFLLGQF
jgi:hypothetical protein